MIFSKRTTNLTRQIDASYRHRRDSYLPNTALLTPFSNAPVRRGNLLVVLALFGVGFLPFATRAFASTANPTVTETVVINRNGENRQLVGEVVVEAEDGGLMFRATDGYIWMIQPDEIEDRKSDSTPFKGITPSTLGRQIMAKAPKSAGNFQTLKSKNLIVVYNTSPAYASWVKGLYLRLSVAFKNYWKNRGLELKESDVPLSVVVFKSKSEFDSYARTTLGAAQAGALAYYNIQSNQVVMYDLTGVSQFGGRRATSSSQLNAILRQPAAEAMVATIVHEAVHQLAYNSKLQNRFGPYPFWLNEGMAMFFEVPDLKSRRGWHGIGKVNTIRLEQFKQLVRSGNRDLFTDILQRDDRFRDTEKAVNAYAEAWALNYYLLQREPKQYLAYLEDLRSYSPLTELTPAERLEMFNKYFGSIDEVRSNTIQYLLK